MFNIKFFQTLHVFNSGHFYPKLQGFIGKILCRSCISLNKVYQYNNNWFGPGIISNARILSKDKLNRFLIDENTNSWFLTHINGMESLTILHGSKISKLLKVNKRTYRSSIFNCDEKHITQFYQSHENNSIQTCHSQKIGEINIKKDILSVYNIELQIITGVCDEQNENKYIDFVYSIGNLNSNGISE